jgi:hypothetical protein
LQHITDLLQWQLDIIKKYSNVKIKVCRTGEEQEGYEVINGVDAIITHANGKTKIESYKF